MIILSQQLRRFSDMAFDDISKIEVIRNAILSATSPNQHQHVRDKAYEVIELINPTWDTCSGLLHHIYNGSKDEKIEALDKLAECLKKCNITIQF